MKTVILLLLLAVWAHAQSNQDYVDMMRDAFCTESPCEDSYTYDDGTDPEGHLTTNYFIPTEVNGKTRIDFGLREFAVKGSGGSSMSMYGVFMSVSFYLQDLMAAAQEDPNIIQELIDMDFSLMTATYMGAYEWEDMNENGKFDLDPVQNGDRIHTKYTVESFDTTDIDAADVSSLPTESDTILSIISLTGNMEGGMSMTLKCYFMPLAYSGQTQQFQGHEMDIASFKCDVNLNSIPTTYPVGLLAFYYTASFDSEDLADDGTLDLSAGSIEFVADPVVTATIDGTPTQKNVASSIIPFNRINDIWFRVTDPIRREDIESHLTAAHEKMTMSLANKRREATDPFVVFNTFGTEAYSSLDWDPLIKGVFSEPRSFDSDDGVMLHAMWLLVGLLAFML